MNNLSSLGSRMPEVCSRGTYVGNVGNLVALFLRAKKVLPLGLEELANMFKISSE